MVREGGWARKSRNKTRRLITFAAELVSGDGDGPTPSSWLAEARCRNQVVASLLQPPLHAAQKLHIPIRGPAFVSQQTRSTAKLYSTQDSSPKNRALFEPASVRAPRSPMEPQATRCCHTTQRVGTQHDAVRTPDLRACVNPVLCPSFPSTSAQTASSPKLSDYWTMPTGPEW
jgi:hypothetical protein